MTAIRPFSVAALFSVSLCLLTCAESNACWWLRRCRNCQTQCPQRTPCWAPSPSYGSCPHPEPPPAPSPTTPPGFCAACCKGGILYKWDGTDPLCPFLGYVRESMINTACPSPSPTGVGETLVPMYIDSNDSVNRDTLKESHFNDPIHAFLPRKYLTAKGTWPPTEPRPMTKPKR